MVIAGCAQIQLDDSKYSAPVPVIGLYIAIASLLCFVAMLIDVVAAFRHRKPWIPCRCFSLNSVTLVLLAVAAKLPVDLTTPMPSDLEQLSKLTGTAIICVCMGFLLPSLGSNQSSDLMTNMAALTIFVLTVIVNICMQIGTDVISSLRTEHIIIMFSMLAVLCILWVAAWDVDKHKDGFLDRNKDLLLKDPGSLQQKLKWAYVYAYNCNPQFYLSKQFHSDYVTAFSIISLVVVIQAAAKTLPTLRFCTGRSDYKWSVWLIVTTQILTIILGCMATTYRWNSLYHHKEGFSMRNFLFADDTKKLVSSSPFLQYTVKARRVQWIKWILLLVVVLSALPVLLPFMFLNIFLRCFNPLYCCFWWLWDADQIEDQDHTEYSDMLKRDGNVSFDIWQLEASLKDMKKWIALCKGQILSNTSQLFTTRPRQASGILKLKQETSPGDIQVSFLSIVVLIRIAQVSLPPKSGDFLNKVLREVYEIIDFIDNRTNSTSQKNREFSILGKLAWNGDDFSSLLPKILDVTEGSSGCARAFRVMKGLQTAMPLDILGQELVILTDFIMGHVFSSDEELCSYVEQLFADMLHLFLSQLPNAISKEVANSAAEDIDKRVKSCLKFHSQIELLTDDVEVQGLLLSAAASQV